MRFVHGKFINDFYARACMRVRARGRPIRVSGGPGFGVPRLVPGTPEFWGGRTRRAVNPLRALRFLLPATDGATVREGADHGARSKSFLSGRYVVA
jgi:hypothetical protein